MNSDVRRFVHKKFKGYSVQCDVSGNKDGSEIEVARFVNGELFLNMDDPKEAKLAIFLLARQRTLDIEEDVKFRARQNIQRHPDEWRPPVDELFPSQRQNAEYIDVIAVKYMKCKAKSEPLTLGDELRYFRGVYNGLLADLQVPPTVAAPMKEHMPLNIMMKPNGGVNVLLDLLTKYLLFVRTPINTRGKDNKDTTIERLEAENKKLAAKEAEWEKQLELLKAEKEALQSAEDKKDDDAGKGNTRTSEKAGGKA